MQVFVPFFSKANQKMVNLSTSYLANVNRCGRESNWSDWHQGAIEHFSFLFTFHNMFLTRLYLQFDFWKQSLRAWSIAWWGQEAKLSMPSAKKKTSPNFPDINNIIQYILKKKNSLKNLKQHIITSIGHKDRHAEQKWLCYNWPYSSRNADHWVKKSISNEVL